MTYFSDRNDCMDDRNINKPRRTLTSKEFKSLKKDKKAAEKAVAKREKLYKDLFKEFFFSERHSFLLENQKLAKQIDIAKKDLPLIKPVKLSDVLILIAVLAIALGIIYLLLIVIVGILYLVSNLDLDSYLAFSNLNYVALLKIFIAIFLASIAYNVLAILSKFLFSRSRSFQKENYLIFKEAFKGYYLEEIKVGLKHKSMTITEFITGFTIKNLDGHYYVKLKSGDYQELREGDVIGNGNRDLTDLIVSTDDQIKKNHD